MRVYLPWIYLLVCWLLLWLLMHLDRSRYRNIIFLFVNLVQSFAIPMLIFSKYAIGIVVNLLIISVLLGVILLVPVFLLLNGIYMLRKEGFRFANLLSLLLGLVVGSGEVMTFLALGQASPFANRPLMTLFFALCSVSIIYGSLSFVSFMIYTLFLQVIPHRRDFDYVIIHGSGLINGNQVPKLLGDRLDKAIEIYHKDPTPPILIPSGGKGSDESVPEAVAMAEYLRQHGIPSDHIIEENASMTTYENIRNSMKIIEEREGRKYTALVTSNYHVYRALRYARQLSFSCKGIGSHVAWYYWPSALIREYVAVHRETKHLILFLVGWLIVAGPIIAGIIMTLLHL